MVESFLAKNYKGTTKWKTFTANVSLVAFPFPSPRGGFLGGWLMTLTLNTCSYVHLIYSTWPVKSITNNIIHSQILSLWGLWCYFGLINVLLLVSARYWDFIQSQWWYLRNCSSHVNTQNSGNYIMIGDPLEY